MEHKHAFFSWPHLIVVAILTSFSCGAMASCSGCNSPSRAIRYFAEISNDDFPGDVSPDAKITNGIPKSGDVVVSGGANSFKAPLNSTEFFDPSTQKFLATGAMIKGRVGGIATQFPGGPLAGKVLIPGGFTGSISTAHQGLKISIGNNDAELFNPATGTFATTGNLADPRIAYTQTLLNDGTVLIAGGLDPTMEPTSKAEIYNPTTGSSTAIANMTSPRAMHTATLLGDGTVLIVGGIEDAGGITTATAEIYNPGSGKFTALSSQIVAGGLAAHTATLISGCNCASDGEVLIAGGFDGFADNSPESSSNAALLYNVSTQQFTSTAGHLTDDRVFHTATLLPNGNVLLAGGLHGQTEVGSGRARGIFGGVLNSAEVFNSSTQTFTCVNGAKSGPVCNGSMTNSRAGHTATALKSSGPLAGDVLLVGGVGAKGETTRGAGKALKTAELYNPATNKFSATGSMKTARGGQAAFLVQ